MIQEKVEAIATDRLSFSFFIVLIVQKSIFKIRAKFQQRQFFRHEDASFMEIQVEVEVEGLLTLTLTLTFLKVLIFIKL
jgi:hypothetical protein